MTVVAFGGSFLIGEEALPWRYLVRCFCLLQATALGYFALASARFPHDLPTYTVSMLLFSSILILSGLRRIAECPKSMRPAAAIRVSVASTMILPEAPAGLP